ncbi:hypothetical protein IMCC3317_40540 [Kordia antarctica]|uniref:CRISPR-associated protein n=1 Tax=Kordia antarctica TaxID=1218801 RepID=A0A7L4ZQ76_9FLAO|nr:DUF1887 family protein [Kordia antarctica]QHI38660.1 hypothetical protein IMCC3317_40540 [Kordia antarctica]
MENTLKYLEEWRDLASHGNFKLAENLYYEKLFPEVISIFCDKYQSEFSEKGVLISLLGFSPEPLILTARAVKPMHHFILTTEIREDIIDRIHNYLDTDFELVIIDSPDFQSIYKSLKEILYKVNTTNVTLDITGGKKSMVASAAIFGKDYRFRITYVDFEEYIKELRKPLPGSEILKTVYNPDLDQPEIFLK